MHVYQDEASLALFISGKEQDNTSDSNTHYLLYNGVGISQVIAKLPILKYLHQYKRLHLY